MDSHKQDGTANFPGGSVCGPQWGGGGRALELPGCWALLEQRGQQGEFGTRRALQSDGPALPVHSGEGTLSAVRFAHGTGWM